MDKFLHQNLKKSFAKVKKDINVLNDLHLSLKQEVQFLNNNIKALKAEIKYLQKRK